MNKAGVHYTPEYIADFVVKKIRGHLNNKKPRVLEPCVGEGVFVKSLHRNLSKDIFPIIDAVEINGDTCDLTRRAFSTKLLNRINNTDYLSYNTNKKYDLIIGNPPYVNKRYMTQNQIDICSSLSCGAGGESLSIPLKNLWTAFIVKSFKLLSEEGVMAFVLPSDLAHVNHAEPIKSHLKKYFSRIELYEFAGSVFDDAEQNVILMIAIKSNNNLKSGIYHSSVHAVNNKVKENRVKRLNSLVPNKWTNHGLLNSEIDLLQGLYEELLPAREFCKSSAGIVTAANDFFILDDDKVDKYDLRLYAVPIIQKAAYVNGSVTFDEKNWDALKKSSRPCYLLDFSKQNDVSEKAKEYISIGIENKINERYKCKQRSNWYNVPNITTSEGFFFKRSHLYPKLIKNDADICVTDTAYSIKMLADYNLNSLIYSFYNSLSLAFTEILGRKYAGGVLELTPDEFKNTPLPYMDIDCDEFLDFKADFSNKKNIFEILRANDDVLLRLGMGLPKKEVKIIHGIYQKLTSTRLNI